MRRNVRGGVTGVGLTKTQQLRQAKTSVLLQEQKKKQDEEKRREPDPFGRRKRVVVPEPKKVDFKKPGMTKTMLARVKAAEKFKQEYERKKEATLTAGRVPKRTPAPIGGDSRLRQ